MSVMPRATRTAWKWRGNDVFLATSAQLSRSFRPDGRNGALVQRVLNQIKPWLQGEDPIESRRLEGVRLLPQAVRIIGNSDRIWGIHREHTAKSPRLSPFVELRRPPRTNTVTVVLTGTPEMPIVVNVYAADDNESYIPPLPWMFSARDADGGMAFCRDYWREHAYLLRSPDLICRGTRQQTPPSWWKNLNK
jgi:hypothetical protein